MIPTPSASTSAIAPAIAPAIASAGSSAIPSAFAATPALAPVELDSAALARLRELDPDGRHGLLVRVMATFESSLQRMLLQLAEQQAQGDAGAVADVAHTLKSSAAAVGALRLSQVCGDVERRLRSGLPGDLQLDIACLLAESAAAVAAVRRLPTA